MAPLALLALVAYWLAVVVAMHILQRELDPVAVPMSVYVLGVHGAWMTTSFFAAAAVWLVLALGLPKALPPTPWAKAGIVLYCVAACGDVAMGLVPTQFPVTPPLSPDGAIHLVASLVAFNAIAFGSLCFSRAFRTSLHWRPMSRVATILAVLMLVLLYVGVFVLLRDGITGLVQRALVVVILLWIGLVARRWLRWSGERSG
jgi:hypothetical protein